MKSKNIIVGVTCAYRFQPNEFREAILANNLKLKLLLEGINSKLILFNDDIDPFSKRHLKLFNKTFPNIDYSQYLEMPIFLIPSPVSQFNSLSDYFLNEYVIMMKKLGIVFDEIINSHIIRNSEKFKLVSKILIENKEEIITLVKQEFGMDYSTKYLRYLNSSKNYSFQKSEGIIKFPWAIECLIRWEMLDIDYEFFTKNYLTKPNGSYYVSDAIYKFLFAKTSPIPIKYEFIKFHPIQKIIHNLLPSNLFCKLLSLNVNEYSYINKESCIKLLNENFFLNSNKTLFEIFHFLSHFDSNILNGTEFKKNLEIIYFQHPILESDYLDLLQMVETFKNNFFIHELEKSSFQENYNKELIQVLSKIEILKNKVKSYEEFKKELKFLFSTFKKEDYYSLNRVLYKKKTGIPITLYLFLISIYELKNLILNYFEENTFIQNSLEVAVDF